MSAEARMHCHLFVQKSSVSAHRGCIPCAMCVIGKVYMMVPMLLFSGLIGL